MSDSKSVIGRGVMVSLAVLLVVAVPAAGAAFLALISLSGCLIECGAPAPGRGLLWGSVAVGLLALPVLLGALAARVPLRRAWPWLVGPPVAVAAGALVLQRVL